MEILESAEAQTSMERLADQNRELQTAVNNAGALLDSMRSIGGTANYQDMAKEMASFCGGFAGKRILDVGCDYRGLLIQALDEHHNPQEVVGLNPSYEPQRFSNRCRIEPGDIRRTPYPEGYFDQIVSVSAFEHIFDLDQALAEIYRILKPGGLLFTHFGPIWSASFGHHFWIDHEGKKCTYWNTLLPAFCHLLMTREELYDYCLPRYGESLSTQIVHHVLKAPQQNKLFYEDYERLVAESPFEEIFCCGNRGTVLTKIYQPENLLDTVRTLQQRYPGYRNFYHEGMLFLLRKP